MAYIPELGEVEPGSGDQVSGPGTGSKERTSVSPLLQYQTKTDIAAKFWPGLAWWAAVLAWFGPASQPQKRAKATFPPQRADQALMDQTTGTHAVTVGKKKKAVEPRQQTWNRTDLAGGAGRPAGGAGAGDLAQVPAAVS